MRKVVSNTTPILSLLKIDKLSLLKELYGKITIPYAVYQEIEKGVDKPYYKDLSKIDWIDIKHLTTPSFPAYHIDLDLGETEVLLLSKELNADLVIIDEILARRYAKQLELNLTGTLGILLKAKQMYLIESVKELLDELKEKGNWYSSELTSNVLKLAKEI